MALFGIWFLGMHRARKRRLGLEFIWKGDAQGNGAQDWKGDAKGDVAQYWRGNAQSSGAKIWDFSFHIRVHLDEP